jgi:hypothetical protein
MSTQTEAKQIWLNWLAISTIILSASATLGGAKSAGYSGRAMMAQSQASDQWAFYQAKSIKEHAFEMQGDLLEIESASAATDKKANYQPKITEYSTAVVKYRGEREEIKAKAESLEKNRDLSQRIGGVFGMAVIYLQIGITLSALAALLKKKPVWWISLIIGAFGMLYFVNGFVFAAHGFTFWIPKP